MALCRQDDGRKAVGRGYCSTHYRRWRSGEPMDAPIRSYVRYAESPDGGCVPRSELPVKKSRVKPFAKETALLLSLGLGPRRRA